ncbi:MAG: DUF1640 domain-containing protein [Spirochaetes bacterium]|nr:DUF1640 domain-containing protein [Spirochaetota bacterium]
MGYALKIYEAFKDDETKARLLSEFIELVEDAILHNQLATRQDVTMSELKLTKEIEETRGEIKEIELKLTKEIEQVRGEIKEVELKLTREIEQVRADLTREIEETRGEIKEVELKLTKEIAQVHVEIQKSHGSLLRWIVGLFLTAVLAQAGLIIALLQYSSGK